VTAQPAPWWRTAVFYEVYLRSFADSDGDGVGDLTGLRHRLPYLADLGVDALWITPFYRSPMVDHGYDVVDPRGVDPLFGDLATFDAMLADAHALGLRVTIDVVPNHTSDQHPWFQAALAAPPGGPERARYLFRDGRGPGGAQPPNNWQSNFGGPAWERVPDGQWYLHHFAPSQPDLNWRNPEVRADAEQTLRFWLDRGVDGFRVDVAHGLVKDAQLRDNPGVHQWGSGHGPETRYAWDQPETHDIYRAWRRLLDSYPGERMAIGEVYLADATARARYVRPDELHLAFNFALLWAPWDAAALRDAIDGSLTAGAAVGAATTWVLSSHDAVRHVTRYGGGEPGRRRARAAALLLLGLPGPVYLYQGEELGLPEVALPDDLLQDPLFRYTRGERRGRDGCRVPLPWSGDRPPYGFGPGPETWLPQPADWGPLTVEAQRDDPTSMLALYRAALATRRAEPALRGGTLSWLESPADVLAFSRAPAAGGPGVVVAVNLSARAVPAPPGRVLLASDPDAPAGTVPPDTAVWVRPER
jgi:alpha-glucosidase